MKRKSLLKQIRKSGFPKKRKKAYRTPRSPIQRSWHLASRLKKHQKNKEKKK